MDTASLLELLQAYKPHIIAVDTGLCEQTVYNALSGRCHPSPSSVEKFYRFLVAQQVAIATLNVKQLQ